MERSTARSRLTVLIDTNVLVSGLVFLEGNEHRILKFAEDKAIVLILPEFVLTEARAVLGRRFPGHGMLLDVFLSERSIPSFLGAESSKTFLSIRTT